MTEREADGSTIRYCLAILSPMGDNMTWARLLRCRILLPTVCARWMVGGWRGSPNGAVFLRTRSFAVGQTMHASCSLTPPKDYALSVAIAILQLAIRGSPNV